MAVRNRRSELPLIGWREWIALPVLGVAGIKAKIDTGARSSALHAFDVDVITRRGLDYAAFSIHPLQRSDRGAIQVELEIVDERWITSSNGQRQKRHVVLLDMELMGRIWTSEVTLTRRDQMGFRLLLGREAMRRRFLVDPAASFLGGRPLRKKKKKRSTKTGDV